MDKDKSDIRNAARKMLSRIIVLNLMLGLASFSVEATACGWWGDGESEGEEAEVIVPGATSPSAGISMPEAQRIYTESTDPEKLTRTASKLLAPSANPILFDLGVKMLERAAAMGFAPAQNNLATLYEQGRGVPRNDVLAAELFEKAARQGEPHAQHSLGTMYSEGRGVAKDPLKADYWISLSAKNGHPGALSELKK